MGRKEDIDMGLFKQPNRNSRRIERKHLPIPTGPFTVGCLDLMSEPNKNGTFVRLFYPTQSTDIFERHLQWPLWLPRKHYFEGYADFLNWPAKVFGKLLQYFGGDVYAPVLWQASILRGHKYPVIVFSHGMGGNRTTNTTLLMDVASYGFVVAAIEHRDGSASMTYHLKDSFNNNVGETRGEHFHRLPSFTHDAEWLKYEKISPLFNFEFRNKQVHHRADECVNTLNLLTALNEGGDINNVLCFQELTALNFKNRFNLNQVAVVGHSFGGGTAVTALTKDSRFKVAIALDGWFDPVESELYSKIQDQPILLLNNETFQWADNIKDQFRLMPGNLDNDQGDLEEKRKMITLMGGCHQSQTDFQFMISKQAGRFMRMRHTLDPKCCMHINTRAVVGFLRKAFKIPNVEYFDEILEGNHEHLIRGTNVDLSSTWKPY
ncbi:unnamed protein product [Owenia fusiformis]|uniref:1-alkyl-2-acetylglycerophosphocholine esterase n=1 Tax=Owenia fusiformis TaxID=6347 RepID=A0A8J1U9W8_OWEFU|nr:unnamed protein product [Owenia fusiformis]